MASASRVPLLVKSKGRKPSRVSTTPRAKPSNGSRATRAAPVIEKKSSGDAAETIKAAEVPKTAKESPVTAETISLATATSLPKSSTAAANIAVSKPPTAVNPVVEAKPSSKPFVVAKPAAINTTVAATASATGASTSPARQPRRAGGISIGGSLSATPPSAMLKSPGTRLGPTVRSPIVLPVQRHPERLAKITSAGPVYRRSPVVRPRTGSIGNSPAVRPRTGSIGNSPAVRPRGVSIDSSPAMGSENSMKHRLLRKLDIKPHQSPRRSAMQLLQQQQQQNVPNQSSPASPLTLGGKPPGEVPDVQLDALQSRCATSTKTTRSQAVSAKKKLPATAKRQKISANASMPQRQSLRIKAKRSTIIQADDSDSGPDRDQHEDVNPNDFDLPKDEMNVYVPARERATMWAKSLLQKDEESTNRSEGIGKGTSQTRSWDEKKAPVRRKRSNSNASSVSSTATGIGSSMMSRNKIEELLKKEPSQMTMGELALTVPKGRRIKRHEREEAASDVPLPASSFGKGSSNLLDVNALNRVRSLSVSSESAAFAGSLVTPQVQIIDGQMVVLENTIKLGDDQRRVDALGEESSGLPPRHSSSRYSSSRPDGPGKRWGKEETKQFYYCLSQVGPNFSLMATLFPTRKRKELKSKFKYEEKNHAKLIEIALRASTAPLDAEIVDVVSQMVDKKAQRKVEAEKKRRSRSQLDLLRHGQDDDTTSIVSSMASSPMTTPQIHTEEFVETLNDEDLFPPSRCGSFDFSG